MAKTYWLGLRQQLHQAWEELYGDQDLRSSCSVILTSADPVPDNLARMVLANSFQTLQYDVLGRIRESVDEASHT
jgi:hypothetical protein